MIGFKFSVQRPDQVIVTVRHLDTDLAIHELVALFEEFAVAAGYARESINEYFTMPIKGA